MAAKILRPSLPNSRSVILSRDEERRANVVLLPCFALRFSPAILPNVMTQAPGSSIIEYNSIILDRMVGFSIGVVELAPKNPPPFVPRCFMISNAATGPVAIV